MPFEAKRATPAGGGGGGLTGADNGLSVVGTEVYLGGTLIIPTNINRASNDLVIDNGGLKELQIIDGYYAFGDIDTSNNGYFIEVDDANRSFIFKNAAGDYLVIDPGAGIYQMGDPDAVAANVFFQIDDTTRTTTIQRAANRFLSIDNINHFYSFGDIDNTINGNRLFIDNASNVTQLQGNRVQVGQLASGTTSHLEINDTTGIFYFWNNGSRQLEFDIPNYRYQFGTLDAATPSLLDLHTDPLLLEFKIIMESNEYLTLAVSAGVYQMGDLSGALNSNYIEVNDTAETFKFTKGTDNYLLLDVANGLYQMGDINGTGNNLYFDINDGFQTAQIRNATDTFLYIDKAVNTYIFGDVNGTNNGMGIYIDDNGASVFVDIGDIGGAGNGTFLTVNDTSQQIRVIAANGIRITGDATFLIHTGTALTNNAGAAAGTLTNAPTAGDPTKWIAIDDNGTTRYIPTWT